MSRRRFFQMLVVAAAAVCVLVLSGVLSAQGNSGNAFERVKEVQERHTNALMAKPGVVGTAVGLGDDGNPAVLVLLEHGAVAGIPAQLEGVNVRKMVTGKIYARDSRTGWCTRPVPIGVSTGHPDITAGTIGCRVTKGGAVYALSNNHVYADENKASIGDNVLQPGSYDGGINPDDAIGTLSDFAPITFHPLANNTIDAAIALSSTGDLGTRTLSDGYGVPSSTTVAASLGLMVQKYGRTTGLTQGEITGLNASVRVRYDSGQARFVGQIVIEPGTFSAGGDSGSLIVTNDGRNPVGLLFAGSSSVTIANPIDWVLEYFGVSVDDSAGQPQNYPPTADFTYTATGLTVDFTDQSTDSDGSVVAWDWAFGDGATSSEQNPSHTYAAAGTYTVTLTVTDDDGAPDTVSESISVTDPTQNEPPTAGFTYTATGLTVDFTDQSTDSDGSVVAWDWAFGDGATSSEQNPSHTYAAAGTYTVTLTVTDDDGETGTDSQSVTVTAPSAGVTVETIEPAIMSAGGTYESVTITGSGFADGASVTFENGAGPPPQASNVLTVNAGQISATVTVKSGGPPRPRSWDVRVTNPDGSSGVLVGGLTVSP